jgi:hypothetical protein
MWPAHKPSHSTTLASHVLLCYSVRLILPPIGARGMPPPPCWRCGKFLAKDKQKSCAMPNSNGPPSNWDIERYGDQCMHISVPDLEVCPRRMVPRGRASRPAGTPEAPLVAHFACCRLLQAIVQAARDDPERYAAFAAAHPAGRHTRQRAAAGLPEPIPETAQEYGSAKARLGGDAWQKVAAPVAEAEAYVGPTLSDLRPLQIHTSMEKRHVSTVTLKQFPDLIKIDASTYTYSVTDRKI